MHIFWVIIFFLCTVTRTNAAPFESPAFPDVPHGHWAHDFVAGSTRIGIFEGLPDGRFHGEKAVTRYQGAAIVARIIQARVQMGILSAAAPRTLFRDVPRSHWASAAVMQAMGHKVFRVPASHHFNGERAMTRYEFAAVCYELLNQLGHEFPVILGEFPDVPAKHWAASVVAQVSHGGLLAGFNDGKFRGDEPVSRYQFAVIVADLFTGGHSISR